MEKRDVAIVIIGIAIVMVLAFIVKPVITGKPVDLSVPFPSLPGQETPVQLKHQLERFPLLLP